MATGELDVLIDREIPDGRKSLQDSYTNLQRVAQYCESNYLQAADKRQALEETKNYTTHSLASVAYQVNNLATNFLKLLDLQQNQLAEMESSVNHLAQIVNIHKEKVARREIGVLTTNRNAARPLGVKSGIIFPEQAERPIKYTRKPIDYGALDEVGHGVKSQSAAATSHSHHRPQRSSSISSTGSSNAPTTMPPTPPVNRNPQQQNYGTIGRNSNSSLYRALSNAPPVAPPQLPTQQSSIYGVMGRAPQPGRISQAYNPSSAITGQVHQAGGPIIGMARPMSSSSMGPAPSPMVVPPQRYPHDAADASLPPPPPEDNSLLEEASPPLPPPPEDAPPGMFNYPGAIPPPPQGFNDGGMHGAPIMDDDPYAATGNQYIVQSHVRPPDKYLEKVVAIYDYEAVKEDELTFLENAVIYVIKKNDDGWWEGVMDGVTGLFPSNYVEPCI